MLVIPAGNAHVLHSIGLFGDPEPMAVTYGVKIVSGNARPLLQIAQDLHLLFHTAVTGRCSDQYALLSTSLITPDGETPTDPRNVEVYTERKPFGADAAPLPQNCTYLIQKRSGLGGRRRRGRLYLPPPPEGAVGPTGLLTAGELGLMQTAMTNWLAAMNTSPGIEDMVILHSTGISGTPAPTPVNQLVVSPTIATQRRRLR